MKALLLLSFFVTRAFSSEPSLALLEKELHDPLIQQKVWLGLVPGNSEEWGHHKAPPLLMDVDGRKISKVFQARLELGFQFLMEGRIRFLVISGGAVDHARPDYEEAIRGKKYLIDKHQHDLKLPGSLEDRLILETQAETTVTNINFTDQIARRYGLHEYWVATEWGDPQIDWMKRRMFVPQGWYLLNPIRSSFLFWCYWFLGHRLGPFELREGNLYHRVL